jgi:predicted CXXCH cytochrome family protein
MVVALALPIGSLALAQDQCRACHEGIGDTPSTLFKQDVHAEMGISCADCHGGNAHKEDMAEAMDKAAGFIGVPKGDAISSMCARCHSNASIMMKKFSSSLPNNQSELLSASVHGKLSTTGRETIAQCTTCHGAHGIVRKDNPASSVYPLNLPKTCAKCHANGQYIRRYNPGLPIDQLEKYRTSVHGKRNGSGDIKVAECANCHGSHGILSSKDVRSRVYPSNVPATCASCHADARYMKGYGIPSDQFEKFTNSVHGVALLVKKDLGAPACNSCHGNHGATPPGVESISKVCGTCHALNADLFSKSPHKKAFDQRKLPECESCHGYHDIEAAKDELLGVSTDAVCNWCHGDRPNSKGYAAAKKMRELIDSLGNSERTATQLVQEAEQMGTEIGEAKFKLRDVHQSRLESRTMVHSVDEKRFEEVVTKGLESASVISDEARLAMEDYYFRRRGLGVATLIITVLAISLYLFIRRIERRQAAEKGNVS